MLAADLPPQVFVLVKDESGVALDDFVCGFSAVVLRAQGRRGARVKHAYVTVRVPTCHTYHPKLATASRLCAADIPPVSSPPCRAIC